MTDVEIIGERPPGASNAVRRAEPVAVSVPVPKGALTSLDRLRLASSDGTDVPVQARCLDRWPDGSARWVRLDYQSEVAEEFSRWTLTELGGKEVAGSPRVTAETTGETTVVNTGAALFVIGDETAFPFREVSHDGSALIDPASTGLRVVDSGGRPWRLRAVAAVVEDAGPLRATVRLRGELVADSTRSVRVELRLHFFAGLGTVRFEFTVHNPAPARHPDGYWDLGDPGSVLFREVAFRIAMSAAGRVSASCEVPLPTEAVDGAFALRQESSGGENWQSAVHVASDGRVPPAAPGYRASGAGSESTGQRATPMVTVASGDLGVSLIVPQFWQNCPAAIEADSTGLTFGLFPDWSGPPHELQGGEQKTHVFYVAFGRDAGRPDALEWCRSPVRVRCAGEAYAAVGAGPGPASTRHSRADDYERLIRPALDGASSFFHKREAIDEFGWRHFGELYGDHETARAPGAGIVSHYNNQYDAIQAFADHFMRTGDWRWWELMDDLARHVVDIDIYRTTADRAAYSGGLFWHTNHYTPAATATHRSYSRSSGLPGGGPSNEHNYTSGLVTHHLLTGSPASADAAVGLARWVVAIEDGARSRFRLIDRGATGLASATYSPDYHGPGRGAGNSINALLDGHRLTGDESLLDMAEVLIRRCVHPDDDPDSFELLDAERRWSYTVFLQVLGKFLDYKRELGREDDMFAYAQQVLLRYARWMARHERPYLDVPDRLEFPTETWAAQDLRKADVFHLASQHGSPDDQALFLERRDTFFAYATDTLGRMPTSTFTRPLVLLLGQGARVAFREPVPVTATASATSFAPKLRFVSQKRRALRRARFGLVATLGLLGALALFAAWRMAGGAGMLP